MAERTNIPTSAACGQCETLLADALDGLLAPQDEAIFTAHKAICPACAALYEEALQGREWLEFLSTEPEVPAGLAERILAHTGPRGRQSHPVMAGAGGVVLSGGIPAWQRPGFMGFVRRWAEPRLMMTAAMAFFSIALTLNLTGVRLSQIRLSDLRPTAMRSFMERRLTMASVPLIRYYDHLHLIYEVQSQMRELRGEDNQAPQGSQAQPGGQGESQKRDGGPHAEKPQPRGEPAQAHAYRLGAYLDACFKAGTSAQTGTRGNRRMTLQNRAFRRLQNRAASGASERSTVWTAQIIQA